MFSMASWSPSKFDFDFDNPRGVARCLGLLSLVFGLSGDDIRRRFPFLMVDPVTHIFFFMTLIRHVASIHPSICTSFIQEGFLLDWWRLFPTQMRSWLLGVVLMVLGW